MQQKHWWCSAGWWFMCIADSFSWQTEGAGLEIRADDRKNLDDNCWFRMISCLIIRPPRMILRKISGHFCQFWNPWARMMASNFRRNFVKLWPAVYPPRMAPFGLKLWENAFQTIPDISFFDVENKKLAKIFDKIFVKTFLSRENRQTACFCGAMDFWT